MKTRERNWLEKAAQTERAKPRSVQRLVRARRLAKIKMAEESIEDSLLEMRKCSSCVVTLERDKAFQWLYYLITLSKRAP